MTTAVPLTSCDWFGHSTFFSSAQDSWKNRKPRLPDRTSSRRSAGASAGCLGGSSSVVGRGAGRWPERRRTGSLRAALAALLPGGAGH